MIYAINCYKDTNILYLESKIYLLYLESKILI